MPYRAPVEDFQFLFDHVVGLDRVTATDRFAEATPDVTAAILSEAGKLCEEVLAPCNAPATCIPRNWKTVSCAPAPALPRATRRLPRAAGSPSPPIQTMAAWACP